MKAKKYWMLTTMWAIFLAGFLTVRVFATLKNDQRSLVKMKALCVFVQGLTEETKEAGLTAEQIQTDVELKLRQEDFRVVSKGECTEIPGSPVLYINISANRSKRRPAFVCHIEVGLFQKVALVREPEIRTMAITWNKGSILYAHKREFSTLARKTIQDLVNIFINDYLAANPKRPGTAFDKFEDETKNDGDDDENEGDDNDDEAQEK